MHAFKQANKTTLIYILLLYMASDNMPHSLHPCWYVYNNRQSAFCYDPRWVPEFAWVCCTSYHCSWTAL